MLNEDKDQCQVPSNLKIYENRKSLGLKSVNIIRLIPVKCVGDFLGLTTESKYSFFLEQLKKNDEQ